MSVKPDDIPQDIWEAAYKAMPPVNQKEYDHSPYAMALRVGFARAIMEEREACALHARAAFDDRPRSYSMDWNDGFDDGTKAAAAAIRKRQSKLG